MKRIIFISLGIITIVFAGVVLINNVNKKPKENTSQIQNQTVQPPQIEEEKINYLTGFAIFTNRLKRSFANSKYYNLSKRVYIKADNPNIVHVEKRGVTWDDFFKTLPMRVTYDCLTTGDGEIFCTNEKESLKFYLNGRKVDNFLDREIKDGDRALITFGSENEDQIQLQMGQVANPREIKR